MIKSMREYWYEIKTY